MRKDILIVLLIVLMTFSTIFTFSWCYILEQNQKVMLMQLNQYQQEHFDTEADLKKRVRILEQDIAIMSNKDNQYE